MQLASQTTGKVFRNVQYVEYFSCVIKKEVETTPNSIRTFNFRQNI